MRKNNREIILEKARTLFLKHGYNGISIRAIAAAANLTTGAVYFHFKNKKDIYKTICFEAIDILTKKVLKGLEERETSNKKLISTFDSYIDFYYEFRDYYNILMEYKSDYDSDEGPEKNEVFNKLCEMIEVLEKTISNGIQQGIFRDLDPHMLSIFLLAITEGMLHNKKMGLFDYLKIEDKDFRRFMTDVVGFGIQNKR